MTFLDRKLPRRVFGYFIGLLLAFGTANSLIRSYGLDPGAFRVLFYCVVTLGVLFIVFYNKITALLAFVLAGLFAFWFFRWGDGVEWCMDVALPFIKGLISFLQSSRITAETPELMERYYNLINLFFCAAACLVAHVTACRLAGTITLTVLVGAFFIAMWQLGHKDILLEFSLCLGVIATVSAVSYGRTRARRDERVMIREEEAYADALDENDVANTHPPIKRRLITSGSASGIALFALPFALFASLFLMLFNPNSWAESLRSVAVEVMVDDIADLIGQNFGFKRAYPSFSISSTGFGKPDQLGGPADPYTGIVMKVRGTGITYLRGSVRSFYTGSGWVDAADEDFGSYRYGSGLWGGEQNSAFDVGLPDPEIEGVNASLFRNVTISILQNEHRNTAFSTARMSSISSADDSFVPYFNKQGELFMKRPINVTTSYTVRGRQFNVLTSRTINYLADLESKVAPESVGRMDEIRRVYLGGSNGPNMNIGRYTEVFKDVYDRTGLYYELTRAGIYNKVTTSLTELTLLFTDMEPMGDMSEAEYNNMYGLRLEALQRSYDIANDIVIILEQSAVGTRSISGSFFDNTIRNLNNLGVMYQYDGYDRNEYFSYIGSVDFTVHDWEDDGFELVNFQYYRDHQNPTIDRRDVTFIREGGELKGRMDFYELTPVPSDQVVAYTADYFVTESSFGTGMYNTREVLTEIPADVLPEKYGGRTIEYEDFTEDGKNLRRYKVFYKRDYGQIYGSEYIVETDGKDYWDTFSLAGATNDRTLMFPYGAGETYISGTLTTYLLKTSRSSENTRVNFVEKAQELARDAKTDSKVLQAAAIRDWLAENHEYTLTPENVPLNHDFVNWFLYSGEGYCTYYATAMANMARAIGIPSRYVEGYLLSGITPEDGVYTVTGTEAHAWAELYFEGIGWVPFDATPMGMPQAAGPRPTSPQNPSELEMPTFEPSPEPGTYDPGTKKESLPLWVFIVIIVAVAIAANVAIIWLHAYTYRPEFLSKKRQKRDMIILWWREINDILPHYDRLFRRRGGETAALWAKRIGNLVECPICSFEQLSRVVTRAYYSPKEPTELEAEMVWRYYTYLRRGLVYRMTPPGFAVRRVLLGKVNGFRGKQKGL